MGEKTILSRDEKPIPTVTSPGISAFISMDFVKDIRKLIIVFLFITIVKSLYEK